MYLITLDVAIRDCEVTRISRMYVRVGVRIELAHFFQHACLLQVILSDVAHSTACTGGEKQETCRCS